MLAERGAHYSKGPDFAPYTIEDGMLITGQNPASSEAAAHKVLARLTS
jgi:putative intracellular protease/amidase